MKRRTLFWRIYPYFFVTIVVALGLTAYYGTREMRSMYSSQLARTLESQARIVARISCPMVLVGDSSQLDRECKETAGLSGSRITIVGSDGLVLGDSHEEPANMENHGSRSEIADALSGKVGVSTRFSNTLQTTMMYVAVPVIENNTVVAVVRTSVPLAAVEDTLSSFYQNIVLGGLIIVLLAGLVSVALLRRLTGPLKELRDGALRIADGGVTMALNVPDVTEIADLAESMKSMAETLDGRIQMIAGQRNEREAILSSMSEGVLALDNDHKVVSLNKVASDLLDLSSEDARGRSIYELVRIPLLLEFIERTSADLNEGEIEIALSEPHDKYIQVRATMLRDDRGEHIGSVLVFNDITRLKKLENVRRDFVANVSHELKTPITAIAGSAETLLDSDSVGPDDRRRFLEVIARQSDRLNNLLEDLLMLARLESDSDSAEQPLTPGRVSDLLEGAVAACRESAKGRNINISISCPQDLIIPMRRARLEQAVVNLIDNSIKYSETGAGVAVNAAREADEIRISVEDTGVGIRHEHLSRLFERFYRVDPARSRAVGGTGLGLAIVKHIAQSHGGRVTVKSKPGQGSTFSIYLPGNSTPDSTQP